MEPRDARGGVLILGGGFAGAYVARLLGKRGATIVSRENFMLYTPLLPEAASGTLEPRHTVVPLRVMCPHAELLLGDIEAVDLSARTATVKTGDGGRTVRWREIVLALGAVPRTVPVPGLAEHGLSFKSLPDAINLRNHVLRELEAADAEQDDAARRAHLSFVFVGAGYAGVEALAELSDLVDDALRYYPRLQARLGAGRSSTQRRRSCPRSRRASASTPRASSRTEASRSTSARRWHRSPARRPCSGTARKSRPALWSGRQACARIRFCGAGRPARRPRPRRGGRVHARPRP